MDKNHQHYFLIGVLHWLSYLKLNSDRDKLKTALDKLL